jgi:DNA polymerase-3 subunit epsilon
VKREIILDTETTGLDPASGHRLIEIGCLELVDGMKTGQVFHRYINPERDVPPDAERIHGISTDFLRDKPLFAEIVDEFLEFISDARLVIHNAAFDMKFVNAELTRHGFSALPMERAFDTLALTRKKFPGSPASLDALCKRFEIDLSARTKHGALLDAELLAEVYVELMGGKQVKLALDNSLSGMMQEKTTTRTSGVSYPVRNFPVSAEEQAAHEDMLAKLKTPIWAS